MRYELSSYMNLERKRSSLGDLCSSNFFCSGSVKKSLFMYEVLFNRLFRIFKH